MKEFILFKNQEGFATHPLRQELRAEATESRFRFHEITEAGAIHEIDLHAGPSASLEVVIFQNVPRGENVWIRVRAHLESASFLKLTVVQNGGEAARVDVHSSFSGKGSRIEIRGLQNAKGDQKHSFRAEVNHTLPETRSDLHVWCAARDEARSVFNGDVTIGKGAHHTEAFQKNKNLMLSRRAIVDSFPKLFIENDNVKCSHGSSTSTLEPDQAYYLQARGISAAEAEDMLIEGFLRQAISEIGDQECRNRLHSMLGVRDEEWA